MPKAIDFRPVILAGGSGTRFWPRSRKARAKQVLALDGERTMIQRTVDRLLPLAKREDFWVITNDLLSPTICEQLDIVPQQQVVCEPAARNTAPAAGLAAFLVEKQNPDAVLGIFPADHVIGDEAAFLSVLEHAVKIAAAGENMVVSPRAITTGTAASLSGVPARWPTRSASTFRRRRRIWRRLPQPMVRLVFVRCSRNCIPNARTSAWITQSWSRVRPKGSTIRTYIVCRQILAGMTLAPGPRFMSTSCLRHNSWTSTAM
jgi:molybdopterin-guanine dinucleotide biosynthesis protein A